MGLRESSSWSENRPGKKNTKSLLSVGKGSRLGIRSEGAISLKRMKLLKEIFDFYVKQTNLLGKNPSFDQISNNLQSLSLSEFVKFCHDFEILKNEKKLSGVQLKQSYTSAYKIVAD